MRRDIYRGYHIPSCLLESRFGRQCDDRQRTEGLTFMFVSEHHLTPQCYPFGSREQTPDDAHWVKEYTASWMMSEKHRQLA